jgi:macrolide transport system ATP-binding/permease protein
MSGRDLFRRNPFRRNRETGDFSEEIQAHIQLEIDRLREQGLSEEAAQAAAYRMFGSARRARETFYESHRWLFWDHLVQDVRFGLRTLRKSPGFTVAVILTLALSIGVNTAIFSLANALLLKSLPYSHPERLGTIFARRTGSGSYDMRRNVDGEQWELLRDDVPSLLSAVSSTRTSGVNLKAGAHVQYLQEGRVSAHYFDVLALRPVLGRNFTEAEDLPHGPPTAILSYELWRAAFDSNPGVVGQAILLKGEPYTVIGVLPEGAATPLNAGIYTAMQPSREGEGQATNFATIVRLRDSASWQQADAELNRAMAQSRRMQSWLSDPGVRVAYYCLPLQKATTNTLRPQVLALMMAAGFILLIACANLAGLTLVRMLRRSGEIVTRLALGAPRWRIQRQIWVESLLLSIAGGAAGVAVGFLTLRGLLLLLPDQFLPVASVPLDNRVLSFTLFLSVLTSLLFGMLPALATKQVGLTSSLVGRSVIGSGSTRLRQGLIAAEVALTVVLLAGAGLLIRTLVNLESMPSGFSPNGVITAKASLDDARYHDPVAFHKLLDDSLASMRQIPGVENAAVGLTLPYERALIDSVKLTGGKESGREISTDTVYVTPGYFDTLQIPIVAGRSFTDADSPDAQDVVIINEIFARKFLAGENPVGQYLNKGERNLMIVGVVASTVGSSASGLTDARAPLTSEETIYVPAAQFRDSQFLPIIHAWFQPSWIVRTAGPVQDLPAQIQRSLASADPSLPISGFYSMRDLMARTLATQRIEVALLAAMALLALLLSAVGTFALVANMVAHRTREIGIRMALGAGRANVFGVFVGEGLALVAAGLMIGIIASLGVTRLLASILYGVGPGDPLTFLAVAAILLFVAFVACFIPARRAMRVDPMVALRYE